MPWFFIFFEVFYETDSFFSVCFCLIWISWVREIDIGAFQNAKSDKGRIAANRQESWPHERNSGSHRCCEVWLFLKSILISSFPRISTDCSDSICWICFRCYAWEASFQSCVQSIRNEELSCFRKAKLLSIVCVENSIGIYIFVHTFEGHDFMMLI